MLQSSVEDGGRPLVIGITTKHGDAEWVKRNTRNYVNMVRELGATPVILAPDGEVLRRVATAAGVDALQAAEALVLAEGVVYEREVATGEPDRGQR